MDSDSESDDKNESDQGKKGILSREVPFKGACRNYYLDSIAH